MLDRGAPLSPCLEQHDIESAGSDPSNGAEPDTGPPAGSTFPASADARHGSRLRICAVRRAFTSTKTSTRPSSATEIQLPERRTEIAGDDPIALPAQIALCRPLLLLAQRAAWGQELSRSCPLRFPPRSDVAVADRCVCSNRLRHWREGASMNETGTMPCELL